MKSPLHHRSQHFVPLLKRNKRAIEKVIYVSAFVYPLTTIPQIVEIYSSREAVGLSLLTWSLYGIFSFVFLVYAIAESLKPLIIEYVLWLTMEAVVVAGIIIFQ